jgi:hypothetical protein
MWDMECAVDLQNMSSNQIMAHLREALQHPSLVTFTWRILRILLSNRHSMSSLWLRYVMTPCGLASWPKEVTECPQPPQYSEAFHPVHYDTVWSGLMAQRGYGMSSATSILWGLPSSSLWHRVVWSHGPERLHNVLSHLNTLRPSIQFTMTPCGLASWPREVTESSATSILWGLPSSSLWKQSHSSIPLLERFSHQVENDTGHQMLQKTYPQWPIQKQKQTNSEVWVRERTIPTKRPPLVGEVSANFCGRGWHVVRVTDPYGRILDFIDRSRYFPSK